MKRSKVEFYIDEENKGGIIDLLGVEGKKKLSYIFQELIMGNHQKMSMTQKIMTIVLKM